MKRTLALILALALSCSLALTGCGSSGTSTSSAGTSSQSGGSDASGATSGVDYTQGDPITIKIAHVSADGVPIDQFADRVAEQLNEMTGGRITVQVFPSSQLGNNSELLEQLQFGTLEMAISSVAFLGAFTDTTALLDLPFLFKNEAAAEEVLDGEIGQSIFADLEASDFHGLAWLATGWRHLTANKEIHMPEDMKGLKIRVMENQMHIDFWNGLGASAVPMAFSELYTALQNGTMDCQENPYANINGNRLYEVQKYIIETGHIYDTSPLLASKVWWDSLTPSDQELITQVITDGLAWEREVSTEDENTLREEIGNNGTNVVIQLTDEERQAWRDAGQPVYDSCSDEIKDMVKVVEEINAKY